MSNPPSGLKAIQPFLLVSKQYRKRDLVVAYYCQLHAVQQGIKLAKGDASAKAYLLQMMDQLEEMKGQLTDEEAMKDEAIAQAHMEEVALKLFDYADNEDRQAKFHRNMIKTFFTAAHIFGCLKQFGEMSDEIASKMTYAKWKAVEIDRCLKNGITPTPGPPGGDEGAMGGLDPVNPSSEQQSDIPQPDHPSQPQPYPPGPTAYPPGPTAYPPGPTTYPPGSSPYPPDPSPYPPAPSHASESPGSSDLNVRPTPAPRRNSPTPSQPLVTSKPPSSTWTEPSPSPSASGVTLTRAQTSTIQKYCKFAASALDYDDYSVAVDYLEKSLRLLRTGKE